MSTQLIECAPCYELKYDETLDSLRDQTFLELKILYGKNNKVQCNCWTEKKRDYRIDQSFIAHMKSQKHTNWREEQLKEHKQSYGHCISSEKIIETLRKELREYKKERASSVEIINKKDEKLHMLSKKLDEVTDENELLKIDLEEFEEEPKNEKESANFTAEFDDLKMENELLKTELEEYQKDIITITRAKDKLQHEINSRKLVTIGKKKVVQLESRQAFR